MGLRCVAAALDADLVLARLDAAVPGNAADVLIVDEDRRAEGLAVDQQERPRAEDQASARLVDGLRGGVREIGAVGAGRALEAVAVRVDEPHDELADRQRRLGARPERDAGR